MQTKKHLSFFWDYLKEGAYFTYGMLTQKSMDTHTKLYLPMSS